MPALQHPSSVTDTQSMYVVEDYVDTVLATQTQSLALIKDTMSAQSTYAVDVVVDCMTWNTFNIRETVKTRKEKTTVKSA